MIKSTKFLPLIPFLGLLANTPLAAGTSEPAITAPAPETNDWWFRALAYTWVTAMEGDVGILGLSAPVDISMADTLESLDIAYMATFEAGCGKLSLGMDFIYAKSTDDIAIAAGPFDDFRFQLEQWTLTPFVAYGLIRTDRYQMEVYGGARVNLIDADLSGFLTSGGTVTRSGDLEIVDPIIGIRGKSQLADKWFFRYNADIGGFGVDSDLNWQALVAVSYDFMHNASVGIGYRALGIDYSEGSFTMDTVTHGPAIGVEFRW